MYGQKNIKLSCKFVGGFELCVLKITNSTINAKNY